jgi:hypothetical protein
MLTLSSRWCQQPEDILDLVDHVDNAGQIAMSAAVALQVARQRLLQQVRRAASGDAPAVDVATHEAANQACLEADEAAAAVQSAQIDEKTREERAQLAAGWAQAELVTMQLLHSIEITINDGRSQSAASGASTDATAWQTGVSSIDADLSIEELRKELQESKLQHKTAKATIDRLKGEMKTQELRSTSESTRMQEELENAQRLIEAAMSGDTHGLVEEMKQSLALVEAERDDALATAGAARNAKLASKTALVAARATSAANARKHESAVAEKDAVVEQMHEVEAAKDVAERKIQELNLAAQSSAMAAEQEKANLQQKLAETQQLYDALISGNTDTVVAEMQQQLETAKGHRDEAQVQQQAAVAKVDEAQSELATVQAERDVAHKEQQALRGWLQAARGRLDQAKADAMAEAEQTKAAALAQAVATAKADALAEAAAAARAAQVDAEVQVGLETAGLTQPTKEKVATAPSSAAVIGSRMPTAPTMSASPAPPAAAVAARSFTLPPSPDRSRTEQPRLRWTPRGKQAADIIDKLREKVSDAHRDRDELHKQVSANGAQLFYRRMTLMTGVGVALITDMFVYWCSYSRCSVSSMHRWQDTRTLWSHS